MEETRENKMGTMPVNRLLISMAVPMMISMLVQALYNVVDSAFVARVSEDALTAVSVAFPVQNLMIAVASGTGVGVNALLSRALGEKKQETADKVANIALFLAGASYLVFLLVGLLFARLFVASQTNIENIIDYGAAYVRIVTVASFGLFGQVCGERLLQATGRSFYSMITQATGAIINIILDPILIFGLFGFPRLEVAGAAIATVIGQTVAMILAMFFNFRFNKDIHLGVRKIMHPELRYVRNIYAIGIPSILMISISSVMTFCMNKILMGFSSTATAVFGAYYKIQSFFFMPVFGLNNGMVPIVAYNYGARNRERILKTIRLSMTYAVLIMLIGLAVFQLIPDTLLLLFDASENMLEIGEVALRVISLSYLFAGICVVSGSVFQALGDSIYSLIISVARQLVVLVPAAYLLSLTGRLELVWWAFPIAELASLTLSLIFLRRVTKNRLQF